MRVLYDGIVFQNTNQRGIQRVFREMIDHMPGAPTGGEGVEMLLALSDRARCPLPKCARIVRTTPRALGFLHRRIRRAIFPRMAGPALRRLAAGCDVFHSTYYTLPPRDMPTVLHVHDLIPEKFPKLFPEPWAAGEIERRRAAIAQATRIITISEATARDLAAFHPEATAKTTTVHLGSDHLLPGPGPRDSPTTGPDGFALFVGDRAGYKNFTIILEAMESPAWPSAIGLTVVGRPWNDAEGARIERISRTRTVRHAGHPSDAELGRLYADAACAVVPSLAEGFGFPVLEAQAQRTTAVCADTAVFREVAGAGAVFFDPHSASDLVRAVAEALDPAVRARVAREARANLPRFTWAGCARRVLAVYQGAMCRAAR